MFIVSSFVLRRDVTMQATASHSRSVSTPTVSHFLSRAEVKRKLEQEAGSHLVFVSYDDEYTVHDEWVYNSADWDASRVIFAHDLGDRRNSELIAAYPQRTIWIVRVSRNQTQLDRYSGVPGADPRSCGLASAAAQFHDLRIARPAICPKLNEAPGT